MTSSRMGRLYIEEAASRVELVRLDLARTSMDVSRIEPLVAAGRESTS